jgi:hypothetical protein
MRFSKTAQAFVEQVINAIDEFFHCSGSGVVCCLLMVGLSASLN